MPILIFFIAHWYLSLFVQTFFLHRYAAHRQFAMSKGWERFFFILTWIFQGSSYLSPFSYGAMHRMHHMYADTEKDPHSPKYSKNIWDMMWKTWLVYRDVGNGTFVLDADVERGVPRWPAFDRFAGNRYVRLMWMVLYTWFYIAFATHWWMFLLLPIHYLMGPVHGAVINWFAHKLGYISFKTSDTSKNLLFFDFLMMGESYHNNHHTHPHRSNFGMRWHEFDPTYPVILALYGLRVIKRIKPTDPRF